MINKDDIFKTLQEIFDDIFLTEITIHDDLSAKDVEEWDSLIQITLIVAVESKFGIRFRLGEVENIKNVGEFAELIMKHLKEK